MVDVRVLEGTFHFFARPLRTPGGLYFDVPILPVWPGFLANTAIYASAWWFLLPAPFALRRGLRRRAGKCVKCKYDLAGIGVNQPCPECGRVDEKRARRGPTEPDAPAHAA